MSNTNTDTYDNRVQTIRASNQPIVGAFRAWLEQSGLTHKTVNNHVTHIRFFAEYLVYFDDPLKKLDEAHSGDVRMFLAYWFPRKGLWVSAPSIKSYMASLKKFFLWMGETGRVSPEKVAGVLTTLKKGRDEFLETAAKFANQASPSPLPWLHLEDAWLLLEDGPFV